MLFRSRHLQYLPHENTNFNSSGTFFGTVFLTFRILFGAPFGTTFLPKRVIFDAPSTSALQQPFLSPPGAEKAPFSKPPGVENKRFRMEGVANIGKLSFRWRQAFGHQFGTDFGHFGVPFWDQDGIKNAFWQCHFGKHFFYQNLDEI